MFYSGTFTCAEHTPHPSLATRSSRLESWYPIGLDRVSPYLWYLGESANPVLHWSLHNSLENSPDKTGGSEFLLTCSHQFGRNFPFNSSTTFWYWEFLWHPRKFTMTELRDIQAESSAGFSTSSLMSSLIWGPSNIPALRFSMLFRWNFWWSKANPLLPLSNVFTKFFMRPNLMGVGAISCSVQPEGRTERCMTLVLILVLMATLVWHNAGHQQGYFISTESMDTLCSHFEVLGSV